MRLLQFLLVLGLFPILVICQCSENPNPVGSSNDEGWITLQTDKPQSIALTDGDSLVMSLASSGEAGRSILLSDGLGPVFGLQFADVFSDTSQRFVSLADGRREVTLEFKRSKTEIDLHSGSIREILYRVVRAYSRSHWPQVGVVNVSDLGPTSGAIEMDSVRLLGSRLLAWVRFVGISEGHSFALIANRRSLRSELDTVGCYLTHYSSSDSTAIPVSTRLEFGLQKLSDSLANRFACDCDRVLEIKQPGLNAEAYLLDFSRVVDESVTSQYPIPFAEGNYWVYVVSNRGSGGECNSCIDSVSVDSVFQESCKVRIRLNHAFVYLKTEIENCDGTLYSAGSQLWSPRNPFSGIDSVQAGRFTGCSDQHDGYAGGLGDRRTTIAEGVGIIRYRDAITSLFHESTSIRYSAELIRYHVAGVN